MDSLKEYFLRYDKMKHIKENTFCLIHNHKGVAQHRIYLSHKIRIRGDTKVQKSFCSIQLLCIAFPIQVSCSCTCVMAAEYRGCSQVFLSGRRPVAWF